MHCFNGHQGDFYPLCLPASRIVVNASPEFDLVCVLVDLLFLEDIIAFYESGYFGRIKRTLRSNIYRIEFYPSLARLLSIYSGARAAVAEFIRAGIDFNTSHLFDGPV